MAQVKFNDKKNHFTIWKVIFFTGLNGISYKGMTTQTV